MINKKYSYRPKRIQFFLVDDFTGEEAMIFDSFYDPVKDGLQGKLRKFIVRLIALYKKERWLYYHNAQKFPSTQSVVLRKVFN